MCGEDDVGSGRFALGHWLEDDVIAALRQRRAVPRPVESDERAVAIGLGKLGAVIDQQVVRRPMAGECRNRSKLLGADSNRLAAVSAILGRQHQLFLILVVIAFGPAVIAAFAKLHNLFGRQVDALLHGIELGPVLRELVAPVLGRKQMARGVERKSFAIADTSGKALGGRERLACLVGVVAPDAAPRL